jgi:anaerobic selenocysteine-containing dehydrogenase
MAYNPPLQVIGFIATHRGDDDRGPLIRLRADEARMRNVREGELVWVYGPRRHDLAPVEFDESIPRGGVVVRDLAGLAPTEIVRLVRVSDDRPILSTTTV